MRSSSIGIAGFTVSAFVVALSALGGCRALEVNAQKDPLKCERDPNCAKKKGKSSDCAAQCSDDPACMDRCRQIQESPGGISR